MRYFKANKAMEMLGIKSYNTLYRYIEQGLKHYGKKGAMKFKEADIVEFMEGNNDN